MEEEIVEAYVKDREMEIERLKERVKNLTEKKKEEYKKYKNTLDEIRHIESLIFDYTAQILVRGRLDKYEKYIEGYGGKEENGKVTVRVDLKDGYKFDVQKGYVDHCIINDLEVVIKKLEEVKNKYN